MLTKLWSYLAKAKILLVAVAGLAGVILIAFLRGRRSGATAYKIKEVRNEAKKQHAAVDKMVKDKRADALRRDLLRRARGK